MNSHAYFSATQYSLDGSTGHSCHILSSLYLITLMLIVFVKVVVFHDRCHIQFLNLNHLSFQRQSWMRKWWDTTADHPVGV